MRRRIYSKQDARRLHSDEFVLDLHLESGRSEETDETDNFLSKSTVSTTSSIFNTSKAVLVEHKEVRKGRGHRIMVSETVFNSISAMVPKFGEVMAAECERRVVANFLIKSMLASCGPSSEQVRLKRFLEGMRLGNVRPVDNNYHILLEPSMRREGMSMDSVKLALACYTVCSYGVMIYVLPSLTPLQAAGIVASPFLLTCIATGILLWGDRARLQRENNDKEVQISLSEQVLEGVNNFVNTNGIRCSFSTNQICNGLETWEFDRELLVNSNKHIELQAKASILGSSYSRETVTTDTTVALHVRAQEVSSQSNQLEIPSNIFRALKSYSIGADIEDVAVAQKLLARLAADNRGPEGNFLNKWLKDSYVTEVVKSGESIEIGFGRKNNGERAFCISSMLAVCYYLVLPFVMPYNVGSLTPEQVLKLTTAPLLLIGVTAGALLMDDMLCLLKGELDRAVQITLSEQAVGNISVIANNNFPPPSAPELMACGG
jgi:hypothetical protein